MISAAIEAVLAMRGSRPLCDACLCDRIGLKLRQVAAAATRLAQRGIVMRCDGRSSGCCMTRKVAAYPFQEPADIAA